MNITEKQLIKMIRESIEEITAQKVQTAINNRYKRIADKEGSNDFYRDNGFGEIDRERTRNQVRDIEKNYNELYCSPYSNANTDRQKRNDFSVSFSNNGEGSQYSMNGPAFSKLATSDDRSNIAKNPRFRKWQRDNGL